MTNKIETMQLLNASLDGSLNIMALNNDYTGKTNADYKVTSGWGYFQNYYYPNVIKESYPVYIQERAQDKGKQAYEIIKILKDKKLVNLNKVGDFIDLMDELIKIL